MKHNKPNEEADITDCLSEEQLRELITLVNEPADKDTISLEEFYETTKPWRSE